MSEAEYGDYRLLSTGASDPAVSSANFPQGSRTEGNVSPSPLRSQEAFDAYCGQIQSRLAETAVRRATFLRSAYERLSRLLQAARAVEDAALYNELLQHRAAVRELSRLAIAGFYDPAHLMAVRSAAGQADSSTEYRRAWKRSGTHSGACHARNQYSPSPHCTAES